jgi:hypothetical protein
MAGCLHDGQWRRPEEIKVAVRMKVERECGVHRCGKRATLISASTL